jgi:hypothetical protein
LLAITRRQFFCRCATGMGTIALASLLEQAAFARAGELLDDPMAVRPPHFPARAKRVIFLHMAGAPSQLDLFDPKPRLKELDGQPIPDELVKNERFAFIRGTPKVLPSPYEFAPRGQSGAVFSNLLPHISGIADDITVIRSMKTDHFNHAPAQLFVHTGSQLPGRPSMGSWVTYGLGSENRDLPGFVVLTSGPNGPDAGNTLWSSGFLPTVHQGVQFRSRGDPVLYVSNPPGVSDRTRRQSLDAVRDLNRINLGRIGDPEIATRIAQYEMAYRMQTSVPEMMDISSEPREIHELYGAGKDLVCQQLPPGAPARRAWRAVCAALPLGMGQPRHQQRGRHHHVTPRAMQGNRPGLGGSREGSEAEGPSRRHPRDLGRRVRPDTHERGQERLEVSGTRSPPARVHDLDGRRRGEAGIHARGDG